MFNPKSDAGGLNIKDSVIVYNPSDTGEIPPVYLKEGPKKQRNCTNLFCCFVMILITSLFAYLWVIAFLNQKFAQLAIPVDANGHSCGFGRNKLYPYIYFATPDPSYLFRTVCVKACPTGNESTLQCNPNKVVTECNKNLSPNDPNKQVIIYKTETRNQYFNISISIVGETICKPTDKHLFQNVHSAIVINDFSAAISNIQKAAPLIGAAAGVTLLLALFFTGLLTLLTTCITWIFLIVYILFTGLLGTICFYYFINKPLPFIQHQVEQKQSEGFIQNPIILFSAIIFWFLSLRAFITVLLNLTKIKFMIGVIKLATKFVINNKFILTIPIIFFVLIMAVIGLWLVTSILILSDYTPIHTGQILPFQHLIPDAFQLTQIFVSFIGLIWLRELLLAFSHFLVASTCANWYYNPTSYAIWQSTKQAFRYHLGSIAAGAIYLFFFGALANLFNFFYQFMVKYKYKSANPCLRYLTKCCLCLCCCCENWIMYITPLAYVEISLICKDFMNSGKAAHETVQRNRKDFALLSGLGESFTHFGTLFIFLITCLGCFYELVQNPIYSQTITDPIYPACVWEIFNIFVKLIGFVSLSTADLFMDMFGQSADALLLTYFTDIEVEKYHYGRDDCGSCPQELKEIVNHLRQKQRRYYA